MSDKGETHISFQVRKRHTFTNFLMSSLEEKGTEEKSETQQLEIIEELGTSKGIEAFFKKATSHLKGKRGRPIHAPPTFINILAWNCLKISNSKTVDYLFILVRNCNYFCIFLSKTKSHL